MPVGSITIVFGSGTQARTLQMQVGGWPNITVAAAGGQTFGVDDTHLDVSATVLTALGLPADWFQQR